MQELFRRPLRIYILLGFLAAFGVLAGFNLPISLFPNSSQPTISVNIDYGDLSTEEFHSSIGANLEGQLKSTLVDNSHVETLTTEYRNRSVQFRLQFEWGTDGQKALREVQAITAGISAGWPEEIRKSLQVYSWNDNTGFLAISFYSPKRSLDEIYDTLNPLFSSKLAAVHEASDAELWNPEQKNMEVTLDPEKMASFQILPSDVEQAIISSNFGYSGGTLTMHEGYQLSVIFPKNLKTPGDFSSITVKSRIAGRSAQLKDFAVVRLAVDKKSISSFKTNGVSSLILYAEPKPGSNIKKMSDDIMAMVEQAAPLIPKDIGYKVLVNPSQFIDSSIQSVVREVGIAALLAVMILFLFIGSLKNVITAAIEIPLSMVLALIFMKLFNMNLNLISLGGLALSAGMNVDASVVVMENIFRHFADVQKKLTYEERLSIVVKAVNEVKAPIISSTVASLVVFLPLIATQGLTNSILGDLAKAVVFSHALSAVVALILVPTIRLQLMNSEGTQHPQSIIEKPFLILENFYIKLLSFFLDRKKLQITAYASIAALLVALSFYVVPRLPKEIVGRPETDWIILRIHTQNLSEHQQLVNMVEKIEYSVIKKYEDRMLYTFTSLRGVSDSSIMIRLKSKKLMDDTWKSLEEEYVNTPEVSYTVVPWNPSELKIPDPPNFQIEVRGGKSEERALIVQDLKNDIQDSKVFPTFDTKPNFSGTEKTLIIHPYLETIAELTKSVSPISVADLGNYLRVATDGKTIAQVGDHIKTYFVRMRMDEERVKSIAEMKGLPLGIGGKILPISALADIQHVPKPAPIYRIDQSDVNIVTGKETEANKQNAKEDVIKAQNFFDKWKSVRNADLTKKQISIESIDPNKDLNLAIDQLKWALALSVTLIFLTMILQFGDIMHSLLVLVAIPLGILGVLLSLWVFKSTLSLNSVLGVILLNGIAVANSVILVDFMKKLVEQGETARDAALKAARARLRPILMTSLTTILGMAPIAFGFGEGGRILQPLGIAVSGGLWVSMLLTIFIVPVLQVTYLQWKEKRAHA